MRPPAFKKARLSGAKMNRDETTESIAACAHRVRSPPASRASHASSTANISSPQFDVESISVQRNCL